LHLAGAAGSCEEIDEQREVLVSERFGDREARQGGVVRQKSEEALREMAAIPSQMESEKATLAKDSFNFSPFAGDSQKLPFRKDHFSM
jgi:hypothetical protein